MTYRQVVPVLVIIILLLSAMLSIFSASTSSEQNFNQKQDSSGVQLTALAQNTQNHSIFSNENVTSDYSLANVVPFKQSAHEYNDPTGYRLESSFSDLSSVFQEDSTSSSPQFFMSGQINTMATNGSSVIFPGVVETNYSTVLIQYVISTNSYNLIQYLPTYIVNGGEQWNLQVTGVAWIGSGYLICIANYSSNQSYLELYNGISFRNISPPTGGEQIWTITGQTLSSLIIEGSSYITGAESSLLELSLPGLGLSANFTNIVPSNSYLFSSAVEGNLIFLAGESGVTNTSLYSLINTETRTYTILNSPSTLKPNQFTLGSSAIYLDGKFYAGGYKGQFNFSFNSYGQETFVSSYSIAGEFVSYDPSNGVFTNLSSMIPDRYSVQSLVNLQGNPALVLDDYNDTFNVTTGTWLNSTEDYLFYSFNSQLNTMVDKTYLTSSAFQPYYALNSTELVILGGYNSTTGQDQLETINQVSLKTSVDQFAGKPAPIGNDYPQAWVSTTIYADGGYLTVGGDGLIFFNGTFESPQIIQKSGFLLDAAWDGNAFLIVGSDFGPQHGVLMYLYYPQNNTLIDKSSLFQASLLTGGELTSVSWYGNQFYIFGDVNSTVFPTNNIFYSFNPQNGVLTNMTSKLPLTLQSTPNARETGNPVEITPTPFGLYILAPSSTKANSQLFSFESSSFTNLSSILPAETDNNFYDYSTVSNIPYGDFCTRTLMVWNGTALVLTGTYHDSQNYGMPDIYLTSYHPQSGMASTEYQLFSGMNVLPISLSWSGEFFELSGSLGNGVQYSPELWALVSSGSNFSLYNLSRDLPTSWIEVDGAASGSNIFLVNTDFGNVMYGIEGIQFTPVTYSVAFNESGLPLGTHWSVTLNGTTQSSSADSIIFQETNGTYDYLVGSISGYSSSPNSGSVSINGSNVSVTLIFTLVKYTITFVESGLPSGATWGVILSGTMEFSSTDSIAIQEPNGSYSFSSNASGYVSSPSSGTFTVNGGDLTESILFTPISQSGYFTGTVTPSNISLSINGVVYTTSGGFFNVSLAPGTYEVKISAPGYTTYTTNITISRSQVTSLQIHSLSMKAKSSPLPLLLIIVSAIVVVAAVSVLLLVRNRKSSGKREDSRKSVSSNRTMNQKDERKLSELKRLLDSGLITKEDFEKQVGEILNRK